MEDMSPGGSRFDIGELLSLKVVEVLKNRGDYTVVERARLVRVLEELRIGSSSLADEQTRLRVGKLVGARFMVFGGYLVSGRNMRLDLRLVEVETGKVLKAVQQTVSSDDIPGWLAAAGKAAEEL
jgi:curli biogenesis system outer membrane secretion channel CsgG